MTSGTSGPDDGFARLRSLAAHEPAGSPERLAAALDLAQQLVVRSATGDAAGQVIVRDAAEALALLDGALAAATPGSAFHRWAALLSARAVQLVDDEGALDAAVRFYGLALAAAPQWNLPADSTDPATATDDPQEWTAYNVVQTRSELAGVLWERWTESPPAEARPEDRDQAVTLLTEALAGPYAAELADPQLLHGTLGLALAGRSRSPDPDSPERRADRAAALRHLQEAYRMGGTTDDGPDGAVTFNLAMLRFFDHDERCDPASEPPEELGRLIAPLLALADDLGEDGAMALDLCVLLARDRHSHDGRGEYERELIDLYRRQIAHPGTTPADARGARTDLALLLIDRAEAGGAGTGAVPAHGARGGGPGPQADVLEAADLFEVILADLRGPTPPDESASERDEERVNCLNCLVELLSAWLNDDEDDRLDRLVRYGRELVESLPADDEARGLICLRIGVALAQRVQRDVLPHLNRQPEHLLSVIVPDPELALDKLSPGAREDSAQAIELLRMGIGFHHYQDELYVAGAQALSVCLLIGHLLVLPHGDPAVLREAVRWIRVVLGRVPAGSDRSMEEYEFFVIHSLMYSIWNGDPFAPPAGADRLGLLEIPDVSRHPSIEDDLQLLEQLLEAAAAREVVPDPTYALIHLMVEFVRGQTPTDAVCRKWWDRLDKVLRTGFDEPPLRAILSLIAAALGSELVSRGLAGAGARARIGQLLDQTETLVSPGDDLYRFVAELRLRGSGAAPLLRGLFGTAPGGVPGGASGGAARTPSPVAPQTAPPAAPPTHHPVPEQRPVAAESAARTEVAPVADHHVGVTDLDDQENAEILRIAAVLPGDGSPYPFTEPVGRVLEIAEEARAAAAGRTAGSTAADAAGDPVGRAVACGVTALARYDRWTHERETADLTLAIAAAHEAIGAAGSVEPLGAALTALRAGMLLDRHTLLGDWMDLDAARDTYAVLLTRVADRSEHPGLVPLLRRYAEAAGQTRLGAALEDVPALGAGDFRAGVAAAAATAALLAARARRHGSAGARAAGIRRIGDQLREVLGRLPDGHPRRPAVRSEVGLVDLDIARAAGDRPALDAAIGEVVRAADECAPLSAHRPALLLRAAVVLSAHQADAPGRLDQGIALLTGALPYAEQGFHGGRSRCLYGLGRLLLARFARAGRPEDLTRAVDVLREARSALNSPPGDAFSIVLMRTQSQAHRAHGPEDATQRRWSRETAKSVLTAHGRAVLLQTGTARALAVAQAAGPDMLRLVRWCMEDGETAAALDALELGRGLVLNAATVSATVPTLLREAGHPHLAAEWSTTTPPPPGAAPDASPGPGSSSPTGPGPEAGAGTESVSAAGRVAGGAPGPGPGSATTPGLDPASAPRAGQVAGGAPGPGSATATDATVPQGVGAAPDGLRRRVLEALEGGPAEARVLSAPTPAEVGQALRRVGADALVHLVSGEDGSGYALIVTATGSVESLPLRALNAAAGRPLAEYADALSTFQAAVLGIPDPPGPHDPPAQQGFRDRAERQALEAQERWGTALEAVCSWAGEVAMTKVLRWARERRPGRVPRLVLAPVGLLGVVPWQAARVAGPAGPDYAGRLAVLSQCATARQLTEAAARQQLPWDGRHALVVDPDGSSVMHEEARLIRSAFYPRATVAGSVGWLAERDGPWTGPAPVPATAGAVLPLLPGRPVGNAPGVAVCHVNCHATPGATTAESRLELSRGHRLAIAELLAAARDPQAAGGLVVLANCASDLALSAHDEALTLSTALLSAGAASVVGSRWSVVDDRRTSILMYMFHHYLTGNGRAEAPAAAGSPADALRAAQLWMLDPHRTVPDALRDIAVDTPARPFDSPRIWAAFAHHGH